MINIQFKLKDPKSDGKTSIRCIFYHKNERFLYSLGEDKTIFPELWDSKAMRPIDTRSKEAKTLFKQYIDHNYNIEYELKNVQQRIENVVSEIEKFISNTELQNRILSLEELKNHLNLQFDGGDKLHMAPEKKALTLNDYISKFIEEIRDGHRTYTSRQGERIQYAKSSVKVYKEFKTQFDLFQTNRYKLNFGDIDLTFYDNFVTYFSKKNYKTNAIGKQIKCLKTIMNAALEEDVHNNLIFQKKDFKTLKSDVDNVYLDTEELKLLHEIDLSGKPHLELARDIFLCGCYTALRYSDYSRLSSEYIVQKDGQFYIDMITLKTKQRVVIPVKPLVFDILKKYDYKLPKTYEQKINKNIKLIAQMCGINSEIEVKTNEGSKIKLKFVAKYELIMTHTARRTGATLLYKNGVNTLDIMKITGHKTEKTLLNYIKINSEENANRLKDNPFFA